MKWACQDDFLYISSSSDVPVDILVCLVSSEACIRLLHPLRTYILTQTKLETQLLSTCVVGFVQNQNSYYIFFSRLYVAQFFGTKTSIPLPLLSQKHILFFGCSFGVSNNLALKFKQGLVWENLTISNKLGGL